MTIDNNVSPLLTGGQKAATAEEPIVSDGQIRVVITYLEMTQKPASIDQRTSRAEAVAILRAAPPTTAYYRFLYDTVGAPWSWYERRALTDEALTSIIVDPNVEVYVLYVNGTPAGFAELDRRAENDVELAYFGLMPDFIGRGLGPYLLNWAIARAWSYEPDRMCVNTCTLDHPKAIGMYQRAGFRPIRQEVTVIDKPDMTNRT